MKLKNATVKVSLYDVPLFQGLTVQELTALTPHLKDKSFVKGEMILGETDPCERILIVQQGRVKVFRTSSSGREQILEVLEKGDTCACNPGALVWSCSASAQALTDCRIWFLSRNYYVQLVRSNSRLSRKLNQLFADRLCRFCSLIEKVSLDDPQRRLVKFILDMSALQQVEGQKEENFSIPFTHEEISQRIGLVRETVTRHLNRLKRARLIEIQPQKILILDKKGLEKALG